VAKFPLDKQIIKTGHPLNLYFGFSIILVRCCFYVFCGSFSGGSRI